MMENTVQDNDIFDGEILEVKTTPNGLNYITSYRKEFTELEYEKISAALIKIYGNIKIRFSVQLDMGDKIKVYITWENI